MDEADAWRCNAPTKAGGRCRWPKATCTFHGPAATRKPARSQPQPAPAPADDDGPFEAPAALLDRDLRGLGWWLVGEVLTGRLDVRKGSVAAAIMRILHAAGPDPLADEDALAIVALRGLVMHGQPPRDEEEWSLAETAFDEDALAELRRWTAMFEADAQGES